MITIEPLQPGQVQAAKRVIASVAQRIFEPDQTAEEFAQMLETDHELQDVDDFQTVYAAPRGTFLTVLDDGRLVGTGAIRPLEGDIAELKRMWLLEEYHGRGIGYRVMMQLLDFSRSAGYRRVRLYTSAMQTRALAFYRRIGFVDAPAYLDLPYEDDVCMEISLDV